MLVEGYSIWEHIIYLSIPIIILLCGLFVIIGFLVTHVVLPFMEFIEDIRRNKDDNC